MAFSPESFAAMVRSLPGAIASDPLEQEKHHVASEFRNAQVGNFQREQDEHGAAWPARTSNRTNPLLRDTYSMFRAASVKGARGNIEQRTSRSLTLGISGSDIDYAASHNFGKNGQKKRRFFYLRKVDRKKLRPPLIYGLRRILQTAKARHRWAA